MTDRIEMLAALTSSVRDALLKMASYTSSDRGRVVVPLITNNTSISPFPMTIVVSVAGSEVGLT
jgi:autophagy-related protein 101